LKKGGEGRVVGSVVAIVADLDFRSVIGERMETVCLWNVVDDVMSRR
jgi:hypothetical protein